MMRISTLAAACLVACSNTPGPACGDGACAASESCSTCSADCGMCTLRCGNGACDAGETCGSCAVDCGACPPSDAGGPRCGDGACTSGETCASCGADCGSCATCGDGSCGAGESCGSCPADCGACPSCGDASCNGTETRASCPGDCGPCMMTCGPATCAGCCLSGTCQPGTAPSACGSGGNACSACTGGFTCASGTCIVDSASRRNIVLDDLTVSSTTYMGAAWDAFGGAPDPIVDVYVADFTPPADGQQNGADDAFTLFYAGTPVVTNVRASDLLTFLAFAVFDEDVSAGGADFIGACQYDGTFPVPEAAFTGARQTVMCPIDPPTMNSGFTLRWHVERF